MRPGACTSAVRDAGVIRTVAIAYAVRRTNKLRDEIGAPLPSPA
jgi:hypothetical protein